MDRKVVNEKALYTNNEALEEAMKNFTAEKSKENVAKLMDLMRTARFLVPAEFPKNLHKEIMAKLAQGKKLKPGEGPKMNPLIVQNEKGERFAPAFTSKKQLPKNQNYPAILNVGMDEVLRVVSNPSANFSGILLNPETDKMILHPKFIDAMKKMLQGQPQKKEIKMTKEQFEVFARRKAEWGIIPQDVYTKKAAFMEQLDERREQYIAELYRQPYGDKIPCPYEEKDFDVMILNINEETCVASVDLPEKNIVPQIGLSMYIIWNPKTDDMHYYMIEKGAQGQDNVLCHITPEGKHEELMTAPATGNELAAILELLQEE